MKRISLNFSHNSPRDERKEAQANFRSTIFFNYISIRVH